MLSHSTRLRMYQASMIAKRSLFQANDARFLRGEGDLECTSWAEAADLSIGTAFEAARLGSVEDSTTDAELSTDKKEIVKVDNQVERLLKSAESLIVGAALRGWQNQGSTAGNPKGYLELFVERVLNDFIIEMTGEPADCTLF